MIAGIESINDKVMQEDLELIANGPLTVDDFRERTIFITGATGLIGSQIVKTLACINRIHELQMKIVPFVRSMDKARTIFGEMLNREDIEICLGDINLPIAYQGTVDYIIHGASATSSKYFVTHPVETIQTALDGTTYVLEFAKEKKITSMVYLSSLEVYGTPDEAKEFITEKDYGYIDPLNVRSSYSEGKRMVECLCVAYAKEYQVPVTIARLSQTFGTGVEYEDGRVFAEFIRCAMEKRDIVLHTPGNTVRTYCYSKDAVSGILSILLKGTPAEAYNVTNKNTAVSIKEMAELVCSIYPEAGIKVIIDIPQDLSGFGYNPEMIIRLDTTRLESLGWSATIDLADMFIRMRKSIEERM